MGVVDVGDISVVAILLLGPFETYFRWGTGMDEEKSVGAWLEDARGTARTCRVGAKA